MRWLKDARLRRDIRRVIAFCDEEMSSSVATAEKWEGDDTIEQAYLARAAVALDISEKLRDALGR
jgi:hypothetical protein